MKYKEKSGPTNVNNTAVYKANQRKETAKKIKKAITYLKKRGEPIKTKTMLANAIASHAGVSTSLILRSTSPHAQLFREAIELLLQSPDVTKVAALPVESVLVKIAELENKITAYERIITDLTKRVATTKISANSNKNNRHFEITCRLILLILQNNPALQFDGSNLIDYGSLTGEPETIATAQETSYFLDWKANVQH